MRSVYNFFSSRISQIELSAFVLLPDFKHYSYSFIKKLWFISSYFIIWFLKSDVYIFSKNLFLKTPSRSLLLFLNNFPLLTVPLKKPFNLSTFKCHNFALNSSLIRDNFFKILASTYGIYNIASILFKLDTEGINFQSVVLKKKGKKNYSSWVFTLLNSLSYPSIIYFRSYDYLFLNFDYYRNRILPFFSSFFFNLPQWISAGFISVLDVNSFLSFNILLGNIFKDKLEKKNLLNTFLFFFSDRSISPLNNYLSSILLKRYLYIFDSTVSLCLPSWWWKYTNFHIWWWGKRVVFNPIILSKLTSLGSLKKFNLVNKNFVIMLRSKIEKSLLNKVYNQSLLNFLPQIYNKKQNLSKKKLISKRFYRSKFYRSKVLMDKYFRNKLLNNTSFLKRFFKNKYFTQALFPNKILRDKLFDNVEFREKFFNDQIFRKKIITNTYFRARFFTKNSFVWHKKEKIYLWDSVFKNKELSTSSLNIKEVNRDNLSVTKLKSLKTLRKEITNSYTRPWSNKFKLGSFNSIKFSIRVSSFYENNLKSKVLSNFLSYSSLTNRLMLGRYKFHYSVFLKFLFFWFVIFYDTVLMVIFKLKFKLWLNFLLSCLIKLSTVSFLETVYDFSLKLSSYTHSFNNFNMLYMNFFYSALGILSKIYVSNSRPFLYKVRHSWRLKSIKPLYKKSLLKVVAFPYNS